MSQWQLDFKDGSRVPAEPDGKRQHVVEVLNTVDVGTSVLVAAQVRTDFSAQTTDVRPWPTCCARRDGRRR